MSAVLRMAFPLRWQRALWPFVGTLVVLLLLYRQTVDGMVAIWSRSETYAHAFVVPPIVLWLVWRKRAELSRLLPQPAPWMLLPMALAAAVWLVGDLVVANAATQLAFTALLVMSVPALLGWAVARALLFPLVFLFFAVPVGEVLTPLLMQWTADFTIMALRVSGVPVYREGMQFMIPTGNWSVVEACSGVRYLMASFMVGSLFAYLNYRSAKRRFIFVLMSLLLPIVANWLRAYMIVMLGHLSNNKIATGADHILYGWVFFGIVILGMFFIGARWAEPAAELPALRAGAPMPAAANTAAWAWPVAVLVMVLMLLPQLAATRLANNTLLAAPVLALPPALAPGWLASDETVSDWRPVFVEPSVEARQSYRNGPALIGVHVAYYRGQTETKKLVSSLNLLVPSQDRRWNLLKDDQHALPMAAGDGLSVRTADILEIAGSGRAERQRLAVWRLYWVGGEVTSSDIKAKLWSGWQRLRGGSDESAAIIVYAAASEPAQADKALARFVRENLRPLDIMLRAVARLPQNP